MNETMLMTQALDERDLLRKKIRQKIESGLFIDCRKKVDALKQRHDTLLSELDTGIKVSNATTFIIF